MSSSGIYINMASFVNLLYILCMSALLLSTNVLKALSDVDEDQGQKQSHTVIPNSPRFIVKLADDTLLCFSISGFELFTFNLITSSYLVVNAFLNLTEANGVNKKLYTNLTDPDTTVLVRRFSDVGMLVKAVDSKWKGGKRVFKHEVFGRKMKAVLDGFGEIDVHHGSVLFSINQGHSNIESQESKYETFRVAMDKPLLDLRAVSSDGRTFSVYVDNSSGLQTVDVHGLIGQFYSPKVRINLAKKEFTQASGRTIPVEEGPIWDTVSDGVFKDRTCWYSKDEQSVIDGEPWEYVVEHLLSTTFKHSLFKRY